MECVAACAVWGAGGGRGGGGGRLVRGVGEGGGRNGGEVAVFLGEYGDVGECAVAVQFDACAGGVLV